MQAKRVDQLTRRFDVEARHVSCRHTLRGSRGAIDRYADLRERLGLTIRSTEQPVLPLLQRVVVARVLDSEDARVPILLIASVLLNVSRVGGYDVARDHHRGNVVRDDTGRVASVDDS
ncbi:MAG: hypothetical protein CL799_00450 [Chromatiales bacterium]|nr:hypothetical protein [Chromatiales bacterium]